MSAGLGDSGTLIVPVDAGRFDVPARIDVGLVQFHRKAEHHLTVFGYRTGKLLRRAFRQSPGLREALDVELGAIDWSFEITGELHQLVQDGPPLQTIVALVDAPGVSRAFAVVLQRLQEVGVADADIGLALTALPPPHVTLFTTDSEGRAGIGLHTRAELELARQRAERDGRQPTASERPDPGAPSPLRAYRLAPETLPRILRVPALPLD